MCMAKTDHDIKVTIAWTAASDMYRLTSSTWIRPDHITSHFLLFRVASVTRSHRELHLYAQTLSLL